MQRSIRPRFAIFLSIALLAGLGGATAFPASAAATIRLGVFNSGAPANGQTVAEYTAMVGRQPDIVMWYHDFGDSLLTSEEISTLNATGQTPMVTWEPYRQSLSQIAAGAYDSYVREWARRARGWGHELMIRFAHEMNGTWYPWSGSPSAYIAAWRHIVTIFREEGATNVRWVWAPNVDRSGSMPFSAYFPGESWVDYIGLDGYNWGNTPGNRWSSLKEVFAASYATITQLSAKPLMITETASSETGGDKAAWIRTGFMGTIPQDFPRVTAVTWFNKVQEDNWPVDSSQSALDAYRAVVACSIYGGSGPCDAGPAEGVESTSPAEGVEEEVAVSSVHVTPRIKAPKKRPRGTVSYRLTHKAKVWVKIQRRTRAGRFVRRVALTRNSHAGRTRLPLRKLIGRRTLRPGRYLVTVVARSTNGHSSKPRHAHFRVL